MTCEACGTDIGEALKTHDGHYLCVTHKVLASVGLPVGDSSAQVAALRVEIEGINATLARRLDAQTVLMRDINDTSNVVDALGDAYEAFVGRTFWQRLRWLFLGR